MIRHETRLHVDSASMLRHYTGMRLLRSSPGTEASARDRHDRRILGQLLAWICVFLLAREAPCQRDSSLALEAFLPDDTLVFATWYDSEEIRQASSKSAFVKILEEPEVKRFLEGIASEGWTRRFQDFERIAEQTRGVSTRGWFAMSLPTTTVPEMLWAIDVGEKGPEYIALMNKMGKELLSIFSQLATPGEANNSAEISEIKLPDSGSMEPISIKIRDRTLTLFLSRADTILLVSTSRPFLERVLQTRRTKSTAVLADLPLFHLVRGRMETPVTSFWGFVNAERLWQHLEKSFGKENLREIKILGFDSIRAAGVSYSPEDRGLRERHFIYAPGERRGVLKLLSLPSLPSSTSEYAPEGVLAWLSLHLNAKEIYRSYSGIIRDLEPRDFSTFTREISQFESDIGFGLESDFLPTIGDELAISVGANQGGGVIPDVLGYLRLRDPEKFLPMMMMILQKLPGVEVQEIPFGEHRLQHVRLDALSRSGPLAVLSPSFFVKDSMLISAMTLPSLKNYIRGRESSRSLDDGADFSSVVQKLASNGNGARDSSAFFYADLRDVFSYVYHTVVPLVQGSLNKSMPSKNLFALLPGDDVIMKHLFPMGCKVVIDEEGFHSDGYSPFGAGAVLGMQAALLLSLGSKAHSISPPPPPMDFRSAVMAADQARCEQKHGEAVELYTTALSLSRNDQQRGEVYYSRGFCNHKLGRYGEARADFENSIRSRYAPSFCLYYIACGYARLGDAATATDFLKRAIDAGWNRFDQLRTNPDLDSIRKDPSFRSLVESLNSR